MPSGPGPDQRTGREGVRAAAVIALLTPLAWLLRFVQDDAYISFRYARNLVEGNGLVYNAGGERVEGYTNFLWTMLMALPIGAGMSPALFAQVVGVVLFPAALVGVWRFARALFHGARAPMIALLLVGTNYTFVRYATGGLETMLQTALVVWTLALVTEAWRARELSVRRALAVSVLAALAGLTRMDSALLLAPAGLLCAWMASRPTIRAGAWAALVAPVGVIVGGWLAWKAWYYGSLFPNTFSAKAGAGLTPERGVYYLVAFALSYGLVILALSYIRPRPLRAVRAPGAMMWCACAPAALWSAYIVYAGGDFMEFRFVVPLIPMVVLILAAPIAAMRARWGALLIGLAIGFSVGHGLFFDRSPLKRGMESIPDLERNLDDPERGWVRLGERLRRDLGGASPPVVLGLSPAGAIAYHSELPVVDMLGLNDPEIASGGVALSRRSGHRVIATVEQLVDKGVHLVIGHPQAFDGANVARGVHAFDALDPVFLTRGVPDPGSIPPGARVVSFPSTDDNDGPRVIALQLCAHRAVDRLVADGVWRAFALGPAPNEKDAPSR
jgi:arabinofuranosyltransferase